MQEGGTGGDRKNPTIGEEMRGFQEKATSKGQPQERRVVEKNRTEGERVGGRGSVGETA